MRLLFFILCVFLTACRSSTSSEENNTSNEQTVDQKDSSNLNQITCWGVGEIDLDDDPNSIKEKVGESDISTDSLFLEGMLERMVTTLWKDTPKEIAINWTENKPPFKTIKYLEISNPASVYSFANGIKIGTTLSELEALNAAPFNLYGFGWDYGGTFINFGKGKLGQDLPCFGGVFKLEGNAPQSATGDKSFGSDAQAFKDQLISLKTIRVKNSD